MGKRHLTKNELLAHCNTIAREKRMVNRTPWTIMSILCSYCLMEAENFKGQRLSKVLSKVNELEELVNNEEIHISELEEELYKKAGIKCVHDAYTEKDIIHKKGSFNYWLDSRQIEAQNQMNMQASRYMLFFYHSLITEYGFGEKSIARVDELVGQNMKIYQTNRSIILDWKRALKENAGIAIEMPEDPLTKTKGSTMTGYI